MARKSRRRAAAGELQQSTSVYQVGAYIRLSAVDRKQKGDSLETQRAIIETYIAERSDMELREVYIDNGLSGQSFERPAFQQMLADMECGKINCCAVKDLSRLGRNAIDTGYYIEKYFPLNNIRFIAVTDNYDSADGTSGGIMLSLKNMINESYALEVSRKVRAIHQSHIRNGDFIGGKPPYGYLLHPENCHKLIVDEYAGGIVRQMFEMAASGQGVTAIWNWLNANDILSPMKYFHSIGVATAKEARGSWNRGVVYSILRNRIYCGDMVLGKTRTENQKQIPLPESEWTITENTHDAIVSRELFSQVQKLKIKTTKPPKHTKHLHSTPKTDNIFLRKVFCGHCGYTMLRGRTGKTQYRFSCNTRYSRGSNCVIVGINEALLKEKLLNLLLGMDFKMTKNQPNDELSEVTAELNKVKTFTQTLYESLILGDITDIEYKEMKSGYESKIEILLQRERQLRERSCRAVQTVNSLSKAHEDVCKLKNVTDLTTEVIDRLIEKIYVFEDKRIAVKFRFLQEVVEHE
jgi:DNA invertase Pin-like site-specific DNA recombinase